MNKREFLSALRDRLAGVSEHDLQGPLDYYAEIIDDLVEDGMGEEEAIASLGSAEAIAEQILLELPLPKLVKARVKPRRSLRAWEIVLIAVGSPVWLPLLLAAAIMILAVYVVLWSAVICLYAADLCLAAGFLAGTAGSVSLFATGSPDIALMFLGAGIACAGLAILGFLGCNAAAKGVLLLGKLLWRGIKSCLIRKEGSVCV